MTGGGYDLLVLGAPLARRDGRSVLAGVVGQIAERRDRPAGPDRALALRCGARAVDGD